MTSLLLTAFGETRAIETPKLTTTESGPSNVISLLTPLKEITALSISPFEDDTSDILSKIISRTISREVSSPSKAKDKVSSYYVEETSISRLDPEIILPAPVLAMMKRYLTDLSEEQWILIDLDSTGPSGRPSPHDRHPTHPQGLSFISTKKTTSDASCHTSHTITI